PATTGARGWLVARALAPGSTRPFVLPVAHVVLRLNRDGCAARSRDTPVIDCHQPAAPRRLVACQATSQEISPRPTFSSPHQAPYTDSTAPAPAPTLPGPAYPRH